MALTRRYASFCLGQRRIHLSAPRCKPYQSILELIGNTPVVRVDRILSEDVKAKNVQVFVKLESFNPLRSVKDRLALAIIEAGEKNGTLRPGQTVVDGTSGNTGIGLAFVCAVKGYPFVATMATFYSIERRLIMRALGAQVVLTPASAAGWGMTQKAKELAAEHGWFLARQFENDANAPYHANTTGPEILQDFCRHHLDYFVTGYGTGGTFAGVARALRKARPSTKIVLVEPADAALVASGMRQVRLPSGEPAGMHPSFKPHAVQGWVPSFIPLVAEQGLDECRCDELVSVTTEECLQTARSLAKIEGILGGISAGATFAAALKIAERAPPNSTILAMQPDTQDRYFTTTLFDPAEGKASASRNSDEWLP